MRSLALTFLVSLVSACTEPNPAPPLGDSGLRDGQLCAPGAFLACKSQSQMLRCDALGTGTITVDCRPYNCDAASGRCGQCDPKAAPTCQGNELVSCTVDGLLLKTACPGGCTGTTCVGCANTAYYLDGDGDGYGNPAQKQEACIPPAGYVANSLDCDDADPAARPGQVAFFNVPTKGTKSFDYNCDKVDQQQDPALANCVSTAQGCQGDGWVGAIPACGQQGTFAKCNKQGSGPGCGMVTSNKLQSCH